jgi:DNA-binding transcriptional MerR regulator
MKGKSDKSKYTIEEVAKSLHVSQSILRFWEEEFSLTKSKKGEMSQLAIAELQLIHALIQDKGLTLEDAKIAFEKERFFLEKRYKTIEKLLEIRQSLSNFRDSL